MIYFDNNDTTQLHPDILEKMIPFFTEKFGNPASLHNLGLEAESAIDEARLQISGAIGAKPKELIFTSGATESNNLAILGAARARPNKKHLIISSVEHASVLNAAKRLEKDGYRITRLPVDGQGFVNPDSLRDAIDEDAFLVSILIANHEIGVIQDVKTLAEIAHSKGAWFHTDAAQALGKMPFKVEDLGIDLASFNAHKLHGPKGIGAMFVRRKNRPKRLMEGAPQEFDLRPGTENVPAIVGFGLAVEIAVRDLNEVESHIRPLQEKLAQGLAEIDNSMLNGPPPDERLLGNLNITFLYIEGEAILMHLAHRGIGVSSGSACSSKSLVPSEVLTAIGLIHEEAHGAIRFSLSRYNTEAEVDTVIESVKVVVDLLRSMTAFIPEVHSEKKGGTSFYRKR
ncbi:MAG: aminotransferase class V-fold PLP-dependent enzyme [Calditrichaeota bacterium]|jgi:cysteine desulfurase|nr:aminotransferase class V-fold PLP-dependent enzyme [Calditrichota bacterium]MBT7788910.1 aminotransferase class V-fold PLP-dependent enzyme [Calditrichota bacterium]